MNVRISGIVVLLLALTIGAGKGWAFDPKQLTPRPPSALDTLRSETERARLGLDWDRAARLRQELLLRHPHDGFALREIAIEAMDRGLLADLAAAIEPGAPKPSPSSPPPTLPKLDKFDRSLLAGFVFLYQSRPRSAVSSFDGALKIVPNDGWAHLYRARAGREALEPAATFDRHLQAAARDPDAVPAVASWLLGSDMLDFDRTLRETAPHLIDVTLPIPWTRSDVEEYRLHERLAATFFSADAMDSAGRLTLAPLPYETISWIRHIGYWMRLHRPPPEGVRSIEAWEANATPGVREQWRQQRAMFLNAMGHNEAAESLFATSRLPDARILGALLRIRADHDSPDLLNQAAHRLAAESYDPVSTGVARSILTGLGKKADAEALRAAAERENPMSPFLARLGSLCGSDWNDAKRLADSLSIAGFPKERLARFQLAIQEQHGDTLSAAGLLSYGAPETALEYLETATWAAYDHELVSRGDRLFALCLERFGTDPWTLIGLGEEARRRGFLTQVRAALQRLEAVCGACPMTEGPIESWQASLGDYASARARIRNQSQRSDLTPQERAQLGQVAAAFEETSLADSLLNSALRDAPHSRTVRFARARYLAGHGDAAGATRILKALLEDLPGDAEIQSVLASTGGPIENSNESQHAPEGGGFGMLSYDLTSTRWILDRMAARDTTGADATYLHRRLSYVCEPSKPYRWRERFVLKLHTAHAVEEYRIIRLRFSQDEEPPTILLARAIYPDGRVVEVPRSQVVVASPEQSGEQVSDERDLVIPFSGLKPGVAIDLVYDRNPSNSYLGARSFRHLMAAGFPIREGILEVVSQPGSRLRFRQAKLLPQQHETSGPYAIDRWVATDLPAITAGNLAGNLFDRFPWVAASGYRTWDESVASYRPAFWNGVVGSDEIRRMSESLVAGARAPEARLKAILAGLSSKVEYLAIELGTGRVVPTPAPEVLRRGYGDCKDMVALAIALLEASGIPAEPVLVTSRDRFEAIDDLPESNLFDHVILWVPGIAGGIYCDPTLRPACSRIVGADYQGTQGLRFGRSGEAALVKLPTVSTQENGYAMEIDVRPQKDATASIAVRARYRGEIARNARVALSVTDSALARLMIDRVIGFGLPETASRQSWSIERDDCAGISVSATYRDSAWSSRSNSVVFAIRDEVADPMIDYPNPSGRLEGVKLDYGYQDTVTIRLHAGAGWEPTAQTAAAAVSGAFFSGSISARTTPDPEGSCLEITQRFDMRLRDLSLEQYRGFYTKWLRFSAVVNQPYRYRRVLNEKRIAELQEYCRKHPTDVGFAIQASQEILGEDQGGDGPQGRARRNACRDLLRPLRNDPSAWPEILLATMDLTEGRFIQADSLALSALAKESGNMLATAILTGTRNVLGDAEAELRYLRDLVQRSPLESTQLRLISALYGEGRDAEALDAEARLTSLHGSFDSTLICAARFDGYHRANRCQEASKALACVRAIADPKRVQLLEMTLFLDCDSVRQAASLLEDLWRNDPLNPLLCNNFAWACVLLGRDLDLAEELTNTAIVLNGEAYSESARNTLGAIQARRGKWKEARATFTDILDSAQGRVSRLANEYFVALCDYQLGRKEDGIRQWKSLLATAPAGEWRTRITRSLELSARGEDVTRAIFEPEEKLSQAIQTE